MWSNRNRLTEEPDIPALTSCMLSRAGDLAHYMMRCGLSASVASGLTPNGTPCTVIIAIGPAADVARDIGTALVRKVEEQRKKDDDQASSN